ncbi:MAG: hypothetical protein ACYDCH_08695 [Gaiellaceae bacterium]
MCPVRLPLASVLIAIAFGAGALGALAGQSSRPPSTLGPGGIGTIRFGLAKLRAVAELSDLFGAPSTRGVSTGCGARYTEVEWGDLVAEFRSSTFSGYRYIRGGLPPTVFSSQHELSRPRTVFPSAATAKRISLGSTLAQVRRAYAPLHRVGADMWQSSNGLVFVDDALRDPVPPSSRIVEIKIGTCGDY